MALAAVGQAPVCPGCGLAAHITHGDICEECFARREGWLGGGPIRVVPAEGDVHETPLCPAFDGGKWYCWPDESACYHTLADRNDADYCTVCRHHRLSGFTEATSDGGESA